MSYSSGIDSTRATVTSVDAKLATDWCVYATIEMDDLNDIYFFASVAQYGGFSAAARTIGVEKTRLSRRIAALEKRLGVRLLQRTTRASGEPGIPKPQALRRPILGLYSGHYKYFEQRNVCSPCAGRRAFIVPKLPYTRSRPPSSAGWATAGRHCGWSCPQFRFGQDEPCLCRSRRTPERTWQSAHRPRSERA